MHGSCKGIRAGHRQLPSQMRRVHGAGACTGGSSHRTPLPTSELCGLSSRKKPATGVGFFSLVEILIKHNKSLKAHLSSHVGFWTLVSLLNPEAPAGEASAPPGSSPPPIHPRRFCPPASLFPGRKMGLPLSLPPYPAGAPLGGGLAASTKECHSGLEPGLRQKPFWSEARILRLTGPAASLPLGRAAKLIPSNGRFPQTKAASPLRK